MNRARTSLLPAVLAALLVLLITVVSDIVLEYKRPESFWPYLIDDFLMAALSGSVVWFYERRRLRHLAEKLFIISEMNHRVRNQLEIIQYAAYTAKEKEHIALIGESVSKIESALTEILGDSRPKPKRVPGANP